jgi:hypothetical protein
MSTWRTGPRSGSPRPPGPLLTREERRHACRGRAHSRRSLTPCRPAIHVRAWDMTPPEPHRVGANGAPISVATCRSRPQARPLVCPIDAV